MDCSPEQRSAIDSRGQNLLIAAAAGSGKTSVLVERIIKRVTSPEEMLNIDRFLVVTFTNAAASEMRNRVQDALSKALSKKYHLDENLRQHISRQLTLLNAASISTLHSFCQSVLRQYFYYIGLDQNFRVANKIEIELLKNDVLEELLETGYSEANPDLLLLADNYGGDNDDNCLLELILKLYEFSRSHPWPDKWLENLTSSFDISEDTNFDQTVWPELLKDKILLDLELSRLELETLTEEAVWPGNPQAYANTFSQDLELIDSLIDACRLNFNELRTAFNGHKFVRLASTPKGLDAIIKKKFQERRNKIKARVKEIAETYFIRNDGELVSDLRAVARETGALVKMTQEFGRLFDAAKKTRNLVDFSDLEHLTLKILRAKPPADRQSEMPESTAAEELRNKYLEIMIDEYQDTNLVQEEILLHLTSEETPNLFMVGDVKQSIYRFRLAEPGLFMHKYATYYKDEAKPGQPGKLIHLSRNYRSRPEIIEGVNFIFGRLMKKRTAEIEYGPDEELNSEARYPLVSGKTLDGTIELCLINSQKPTGQSEEDTEFQAEDGNKIPDNDLDTISGENDAGNEVNNASDLADHDAELSGFEQESLLIAQKIEGLISGGYLTYDKNAGNYRPLTFRDIVVLLRADQGKAAIMLEILRQNGIPCYAQTDTGYFKETEVAVMLSLLNIIDNPRQDISLAAVLRSPLAGLDVETIAQIRLNKPEGDLWEALVYSGQPGETKPAEIIAPQAITRINLFLQRHEKWRNLARRKDIAKLIHTIYEETNFYDYVGGMPGGTFRQANLNALYNRAKEFQSTDYRGLFQFLRFIGKLKESGSDLAVAKALGEGENVVRVMSIHKSKGLEFPVVIVADLGKKFNLRDASSPVLFHKELGIGPYVNLAEERLRYPTPARWGISHKIEMESKAEELRILYVALTRAREKLILVGSAKKSAQMFPNLQTLLKTQNNSVSRPRNPSQAQILKAKSYLELLHLALNGQELPEEHFSHLSEQQFPFKITVYPDGYFARKSSELKDTGQIWEAIRNGRPLPEASDGQTNWVKDVLEWSYPYNKAVGKPAKLTVSEIKRRLETEEQPLEHFPGIVRTPESPALRPRFLQEKSGPTKIEYGIALHTLLQHLALDSDLSVEGIAAQAATLVKKELLLSSQIETLNYKKIAAFFSCGLGQRLLKSNKVWREIPFSLLLDAAHFYPELKNSGEQVFVQGVIDCMFAEGEEIVLIDYKTDRVVAKEELANKYAAQLSMYCMAVESILGLTVKEQYIYSFAFSEAIELSGWG